MAEALDGRKMAARIHEAFRLDSRLRSEGITVQIENGVATLTGTVRSYRDRMLAAEDAWGVQGVKEVRNRLRVRPDTLRAADKIAADVANTLDRQFGVDARSIVVNVSEGLVRLSGTVVNQEERASAEECAWQVQGVVDVSNELAISTDQRRPDAEIEQDVRAALDIDASLADPTKITVKCVAGTIRLEGTVSSPEERQAAEKDAWYTAGVVYVENMLATEGERQQPAAA